MTDNEIIKALENCNLPYSDYKCVSCPLYDTESNCKTALIVIALDLINRQKAEIERLKKELHDCVKEVSRSHEIDRIIAIREFAERLKENVTHYEDECGEFVPWVDCRDIDNLVKEKTEQ